MYPRTSADQIVKADGTMLEDENGLINADTLDGNDSSYFASASALNTISNKLPFSFGIDADGNYGYIKAGADTVTPFKRSVSIDEKINFNTSAFTADNGDDAIDIIHTITNNDKFDRIYCIKLIGNIPTLTVNSVSVTNGGVLHYEQTTNTISLIFIWIKNNSTATLTVNEKHYSPNNVKNITWSYLSI